MQLNIYKNQKEIDRTLQIEAYDIMYGTVEDLLSIMDDVEDANSEESLFNAIKPNLPKIKRLIKDVFSSEGITDEDLRNIKVKELIPFFVELLNYTGNSIDGESRNRQKN